MRYLPLDYFFLYIAGFKKTWRREQSNIEVAHLVQIFPVAKQDILCRQPRGTGTFERGKQNAKWERDWSLEAGAPPNSPTGAGALVRFLWANFTRWPEVSWSHWFPQSVSTLNALLLPFVGPFRWRAALIPTSTFRPSSVFFVFLPSPALQLSACFFPRHVKW